MKSHQSLLFAPLGEEAIVELNAAREFMTATVKQLLGPATLTRTESDLHVLQMLAEHDSMKAANYEAWIALGVVFGDAICALIPGLEWRQVTDEFGEHVALQYRDKAISIAAPTMPWKRIQRGEALSLSYMANELRAYIEENGNDTRKA